MCSLLGRVKWSSTSRGKALSGPILGLERATYIDCVASKAWSFTVHPEFFGGSLTRANKDTGIAPISSEGSREVSIDLFAHRGDAKKPTGYRAYFFEL